MFPVTFIEIARAGAGVVLGSAAVKSFGGIFAREDDALLPGLIDAKNNNLVIGSLALGAAALVGLAVLRSK